MKAPFILSIILLPLTTIKADKYKKAGDTVVLSPGSVSGPITSITWKHNSNLAVEWYGGTIDFYPKFKDRCKLNTTTGELTFPNVTLEDSGSYTAEINNRVLNPTEISVISEVPTPTVSESCDAEKTHCVLTCEGITTDAEPVVYSWWSGDVMKSKTKELNITKEEKDPSFICKMKNQVSFESSKEVVNPFITSSSNTVNQNLVLLLFVLILVILVIVVVVGVLFKLNLRTPVLPLQISTEYDTVHAPNNDYVEMPPENCDRTVYATVETVNKRPDYLPMPNCDRTVYATVQDVSNRAGYGVMPRDNNH